MKDKNPHHPLGSIFDRAKKQALVGSPTPSIWGGWCFANCSLGGMVGIECPSETPDNKSGLTDLIVAIKLQVLC